MHAPGLQLGAHAAQMPAYMRANMSAEGPEAAESPAVRQVSAAYPENSGLRVCTRPAAPGVGLLVSIEH